MKFKLRRFKRRDQESLRRNINDKKIARNTLTIPHPYKKKDARYWINHNLRLYKFKKPKEINWVIDINGEVAGSVGLAKIDRINKNAEIGFWLAKKYWNQGIMTRAVRQIIKFGFKKLKLKRIYAYVFVFNKASQKVLEKTGFKLEGKLQKHVLKNGRYYDDLVYSKIH
ncbi:MAG: GNAT family N-acetyltransferase [Candidatus Pacearchaeota archaeon]